MFLTIITCCKLKMNQSQRTSNQIDLYGCAISPIKKRSRRSTSPRTPLNTSQNNPTNTSMDILETPDNERSVIGDSFLSSFMDISSCSWEVNESNLNVSLEIPVYQKTKTDLTFTSSMLDFLDETVNSLDNICKFPFPLIGEDSATPILMSGISVLTDDFTMPALERSFSIFLN